MFSIHLAEVCIPRKEPRQDFDAQRASVEVARRFSRIAERVVQKALLKSATSTSRKSAEDKIRDMIESEERLRTVKSFLELWNKWRYFYFGLEPLNPKNKGQLSMIEGAIEFCELRDLNLNMMIACVHKAHEKRKLRPNFNAITSYGEEFYDRFYDSVLNDIDEVEYRERSMKRRV